MRKKSERIVKLLEKGPLFKQERDKARKVSRGIQGFGSFSVRTTDHQQSSLHRCNSDSTHNTDQPDSKPERVNSSTKNFNFAVDSKENMAPREGTLEKEVNEGAGEGKPLLSEKKADSNTKASIKNHHPFEDSKHLPAISLLSGADELQAY